MALDTHGVAVEVLGSLGSCLVDDDTAQEARARKLRRRAIFASVVVQALFLAALWLFPLLGKSERIPVRIFVEQPPYAFGHANNHDGNSARHPRTPSPDPFCFICKQPPKPGRPTVNNSQPTNTDDDDQPNIPGAPDGRPDGLIGGNRSTTPIKPRQTETALVTTKPARIHITEIQPALLVRRVEPVYPVLGVQLRRETRVELHAVIATDGTIQSLQAISGSFLG